MIDFTELSQRADDAGMRVEVIGGLPVWEGLPNLTHQKAIDRIRQSLTRTIAPSGGACACAHYADLHIRFPDGSDKRTDIAIFCQEPDETDTAVTAVPEVVIEVLNRGYEKKDLELGPPFYLGHGVKEVFVFDPYTKAIHHFVPSGEHHYHSPHRITMQCGCQVTI